jgi:cytochrome c-type biogenesis protein CcmH
MSARRLGLLLVVLALIGAAGWAARPQPVTDAQRVARIGAELRCPVCQGLSVQDSPAETAREMRDLVAQRVAEGRTDDEIRAEFRRSYGDWVFLTPPLGGPSALVWLVPVLLVLGGGAVAIGRVRRPPAADAAGNAVTASPVDPALVHELRARVAREEAAEG